MEALLSFIRDILKEPAFLMGLIAFAGLVALKTPAHKVLTGTLGPILGYLMLAAGAGVIVTNLDPLAKLIEHGFSITGVVPNNEAVTSVAQKILGGNHVHLGGWVIAQFGFCSLYPLQIHFLNRTSQLLYGLSLVRCAWSCWFQRKSFDYLRWVPLGSLVSYFASHWSTVYSESD
ncbi:PTS system ascorbate-specific transporter subunit IIC [Streptococcus dysgalactiae]|uniref:Ascorbate-specific PTS system EIIC component n=1 Tax=Streptococcus dysgalactiae TaxID=1334 RepID=A0A9X9QNH9_STRDY|nr:PTS system ascorbate-specific transporter subunit IIC [Streptococcus dysgalactiae]